MRLIRVVVGAVALVAAGFGLLWAVGRGVPPPLVRGAEAPDFRLPRLDGDGAVALEDLRGRVVLVNFWATWCKPCEDEIPAMERLYEALDGSGFELLAVSVDEEPAPVTDFRDRLGIRFPILLDPDQRVARLYQTTGFPESILVDRDGRVVERYVGPRDWDAAVYQQRIRALLASPSG